MVLSDRSIREEMTEGRLVIDPLGANAVQPSSVDLGLGRKCVIFRARTGRPLAGTTKNFPQRKQRRR